MSQSSVSQNSPTSSANVAKPPRSKLPMYILGAVIVGGAVFGGYTAWSGRNEASTDDAFVDGHAVLMMSQDAGAIVQLSALDNHFVHKGDVLAVIDQRNYNAELDEAKGDLATAQAQLATAKLQLTLDRTIYPAQLAAAKAKLASAQALAARAQSDAARQHRVDRAATTVENIDQADASLQEARAQVAEAQAQVAQADVVDQNLAIAAADVTRLQGDVLSKQAKLDSAYADFYNTTIVAPQDGWITKKNIEIGTFVQPGSQLFQIVTPDVFVTANFKEAQLTRMRAGDKVAITVDAYPDLKLQGHVDSIQLGTGSRFTAFPAENATGNFVKIVQRVPVKILIDSGLDPAVPLSLGLSVEPTVTFR